MSKVEELLDELSGYAYEVRCDWGDFDGRDLLKYVADWRARMEDALNDENSKD